MKARISSRRVWAIAGVATGLLAIFYSIFAADSPEEQIRHTLDRLERAASFAEPGGNLLVMTGELNEKFKEVFAKEVRVSIPELTSLRSGRRELAAVAARARLSYDAVDLRLSVDELQLHEERRTATVQATAELQALKGQRLRRDERRAQFGFRELDGNWVIDSVAVSPDSPDG